MTSPAPPPAARPVAYGDTDVLRRRVDAVREQAVDLRSLADHLVARTDAVAWTGRAARSMRERVAERAAHLREAAGAHDVAADALEAHLQEVDRVGDRIAEIERRAAALIADADARVRALPGHDGSDDVEGDAGSDGDVPVVEPDPHDVALLGFEPPRSGHLDWLDVDLPGLRSAD